MNRYVVIIFGCVVVLVILILYLLSFSQKSEEVDTTSYLRSELSEEVNVVLNKKIVLIEEIANNSIVVEEVEKSNVANKNLTKSDIEELDQRWRNTVGIDNFIKQFLLNEVAFELLLFQEKHFGFSEIFVTDKYGLNVGQTNKTTDYYQADEDWWTDTYTTGKSSHGVIEHDESSNSDAVSLYVPVFGDDNEIIGVIKAVLNIIIIQQEVI